LDIHVLHGDYGTDSGYDLTRKLFERHRPTALVCGNDRMALGALLVLCADRTSAPPHRTPAHQTLVVNIDGERRTV
jgi:DNA-binding LacI/PurR family transcriptional regulator